MQRAGQARRDTQAEQPLRLPTILDVERITVCDLAEGTAIQGVHFLGDLEIQVNRLVPLGTAAAALHFIEQHARRHQRWCEYATCPAARDWLAAESIRGPAISPPLASA